MRPKIHRDRVNETCKAIGFPAPRIPANLPIVSVLAWQLRSPHPGGEKVRVRGGDGSLGNVVRIHKELDLPTVRTIELIEFQVVDKPFTKVAKPKAPIGSLVYSPRTKVP